MIVKVGIGTHDPHSHILMFTDKVSVYTDVSFMGEHNTAPCLCVLRLRDILVINQNTNQNLEVEFITNQLQNMNIPSNCL